MNNIFIVLLNVYMTHVINLSVVLPVVAAPKIILASQHSAFLGNVLPSFGRQNFWSNDISSLSVGMFHKENSLVVTRYWQLILLSKIWWLLILSYKHQNDIILRIPNLRLFFMSLQWLLSYHQFFDYSQNKSFKKYLEPLLPPAGRNLQLLHPYYLYHH